MPTVTLAMERGVAAPRVAYVPFPYNFPVGGPEDSERHWEIVVAALEVLERAESAGERDLPFEWR